jgi:hypothetical protein
MIQVIELNTKTTTLILPTKLAKEFWDFAAKNYTRSKAKIKTDFPEADEIALLKEAKKWKKSDFMDLDTFFKRNKKSK